MTEKQAYKEAVKRFGSNGAVQYNKNNRSTPEERLAASTANIELRQKVRECEDKDQKKVLSERQRDAMFAAMRYAYSVGSVELGMFFSVKGQGDSWDEAFLDADRAEAAQHDQWYHSGGHKCPTCKRKKRR